MWVNLNVFYFIFNLRITVKTFIEYSSFNYARAGGFRLRMVVDCIEEKLWRKFKNELIQL
jgi:hypothetical protein